MPDLPTGTVTFLFTDIEGSTSLAQQYPAELPALLARHHAILHQAIQAHNGHVFQITGDAFCAAFYTASDALKAALDAQHDLQHERWDPAPIKVRMGIHTGAAQAGAIEERAGGYVGYLTLTRVQRVMSTAHGEQVLLSNPAAELARGELPADVTLRDMGEHRLKGLHDAERLWQLVTPDVRQDFPPLQSLNAILNNLPVQLTSFIGREKDIAAIRRLLSSARLVTLMASGGAGKTRLSLQVAAQAIDNFDNGSWFIDLAPLSDATMLPNAVLRVLGLRDEPGRTPLDLLTEFLHARAVLLILDNCEHLIQGCTQLAHHLLTHCLQLRILATSREALDVVGETIYHVPSLTLADPQHLPSLQALAQYEAVRLFVERATAVQAHFALTNSNAPAVAQICFRLDGIPLALELAAARVKLFSPEQIASRLDDRFRLLTGGSRTALPRQQTLRAAIEWSYSLLSEPERILFRRLSVFVGGWTFEAAEQVCTADHSDSLDVMELLAHLVDKSLVTTEAREEAIRYRMLETIRHYALERLVECGERDMLRSNHAGFFLNLAEEAEPHLITGRRQEWLVALEAELDNLRAALTWSQSRTGDMRLGLRLASALGWFWFFRGHLNEGRAWLEGILAQANAVRRMATAASALSIAGGLAWAQGDYASARGLLEESIAIGRELGASGKPVLAQSVMLLGFVSVNQGQPDAARALLTESLTLSREEGNDWLQALALSNLGDAMLISGDAATARSHYQESLALFRQLDDSWGRAIALYAIGRMALSQGEASTAHASFEESAALCHNAGDRWGTARGLLGAANAVFFEGDIRKASVLFQESIVLDHEVGNSVGILIGLAGLASTAAALGDLERAARLAGVVDARGRPMGTQLWRILRPEYERRMTAARAQADASVWASRYSEGQLLTLDRALNLALEHGADG